MKKMKKVTSALSVPMHPLSNNVLVRPLSPDEMGTKTASGIIIPDTAKKESKEGTVVAVGPGKWNEDGDARTPVSVKVGDRVIFKEGYDSDVEIERVKYFIVPEDSILAVIN